VQSTTAIVRMLGKAVKLRHCPATVSASGSTDVERGDQPEFFAQMGEGSHETTGA
jgi:hypothetical protein